MQIPTRTPEQVLTRALTRKRARPQVLTYVWVSSPVGACSCVHARVKAFQQCADQCRHLQSLRQGNFHKSLKRLGLNGAAARYTSAFDLEAISPPPTSPGFMNRQSTSINRKVGMLGPMLVSAQKTITQQLTTVYFLTYLIVSLPV
eukprot:4860533-Pleurochrysis_carterae.AAC.1